MIAFTYTSLGTLQRDRDAQLLLLVLFTSDSGTSPELFLGDQVREGPFL